MSLADRILRRLCVVYWTGPLPTLARERELARAGTPRQAAVPVPVPQRTPEAVS